MKSILTLAIPTYNRVDKLQRLLHKIQDELNEFNIAALVQILITDNSKCKFEEVHNTISHPVNYYWNNVNIGYDRNIINCITKSKTKYVWFMGDDDIIENGVLLILLEYLRCVNPSLLILKFGQFNAIDGLGEKTQGEGWYQFSNFEDVARLILKSQKLTNYIINRELVIIDDNLYRFIGTGWMHQIIALESMVNTTDGIIHYLNQVCAHSLKSEVEALEWTPLAYRKGAEVVKHPYFSSNKLSNSKVINDYLTNLHKSELNLLLYGLSGYWKVKNRDSYKDYYEFTTYSDFSKLGFKYTFVYFILYLKCYKILLLVIVLKNKINDLFNKK